MRDKPIKTGFGTLGNGPIRPDGKRRQKMADAENPIAARFFTLGTMGKNSICRKWWGSLGTHSPFREVCRNCHNTPPRWFILGIRGAGA